QLAGAQCEFLLLVGEFDAVEGWRSWELGSTANWLSWKCGVGAGAAREQVRGARVLRHFPELVTPFSDGRLSYSKVRAITRIATEDTLSTWIEWGLSTAAAVVERLVAAARRSMATDEAQRQHAGRRLNFHWDSDGCLVGSFRLPPAEGAQFLVALD